MVAFQKQLLPRQLFQKFKVRGCFFQLHAPAGVPRKHHRVAGGDQTQPVLPDALHIALPAGELVHRLVGAQREVQIAYYKNCHAYLLIIAGAPGTIRPEKGGKNNESERTCHQRYLL